MTLGQKQRIFSRLVGLLLLKAYELGFEVSLGEALRSPEQARRNAETCRHCKLHISEHSDTGHCPKGPTKFRAVGIADSLHCSKLAIDLNLFKNGHYLQASKSYTLLGEWWEKQHELCRWGGRFGDGNHFSLAHGGRL